MPNADMDAKQLKHSYIAVEHGKWYGHCGKLFFTFSIN